MDIGKLILSQVDIGSLSNKLGADKSKVSKATTSLIPELVSGMNKNVKSESGLSSLFSALDDHKDSNIGDTKSFFDKVDLKDGEKILGHLLGKDKSKVEKKITKESGLNASQTGQIMAMLAPLLMGYLGSQKKKQAGFNPSTLLSMLGGGSVLETLTGSKKTSKKKDSNLSSAVNIIGSLFKKK